MANYFISNIFAGRKGCHRGCHVLESQSKEMRSCSFPFIYADKTYKTCTDVDVSLFVVNHLRYDVARSFHTHAKILCSIQMAFLTGRRGTILVFNQSRRIW